MKKDGISAVKEKYEDIHMPKNTAVGIYISAFALLLGFSMSWEIYWLAVVSLIGAVVIAVRRAFDEHTEYVVTAAEVAKIEAALRKK
jgi:cytochrome o ubiquinol oxidase subunit 1